VLKFETQGSACVHLMTEHIFAYYGLLGWDMTSCRQIPVLERKYGTSFFRVDHWHPPTRLHDVATQMTTIWKISFISWKCIYNLWSIFVPIFNTLLEGFYLNTVNILCPDHLNTYARSGMS
jgi:hypothetical protein